MQNMPPSYVPKKQGRSCLMSGCLVLAGLVGLVVVLIVGGCVYLTSSFKPFITEQPVALRANDTTKEQYMAAARKLQPLLNPDAPGQTEPAAPVPVSLGADDLNAFVAHDPHFADAKDKCYFTIPGDQLVVDLSAEVPDRFNRGRTKTYFNARVTGGVDISGGTMRLNPRKIESLDGKPLPGWLTSGSVYDGFVEGLNKGINESIHNNTDASEALARIGSTKIANGQITFIPAARPAGTPAAPVATPANP